jgi:hypothetical protein
MKPLVPRWLAPLLLLAATLPAQAHDYPTSDRVIWVQTCMQENPGPYYEMVSKCSCALDRIARDVKFDDFTTMSTDTNALTIGGERGGALRGNEQVQQTARKWRQVQADARKACMIDVHGPRAAQAPAAAPSAASAP